MTRSNVHDARRSACALAFAVVGLAACSNLTAAVPGVCGNGAVDPGEDCDGASAAGTCGDADDANACHFVCSGGAACPTGYACGNDARCRAPSGTFATVPFVYPFQATQAHAGDTDGDGYADLTGIEGDRLLVRYGSANGDLGAESTQVAPASVGTIGYGDFDGDGREDLALPTTLGVVTLLGSAARDYAPYAYESLDLTTSVGGIHVEPVRQNAIPVSMLLSIYDQVGLGTETLHNQMRFSAAAPATFNPFATCFDGNVIEDVGSASDPDCATGSGNGVVTIEDLVGDDIVVGHTGAVYWYKLGSATSPNLITTTTATDPTDEVAIVRQSAKGVYVLSATELTDGIGAGSGTPYPNTWALRPTAFTTSGMGSSMTTLPTLVPISTSTSPVYSIATDGRAMFVDVDGDGWNDLVVPIAQAVGATGGVFSIMPNNRLGVIGTGVVVTSSAFSPATGIGGVTVPIGKPRLFADLDGDGKPDLVTDQQVFIASCSGPACAGWTGAGIAVTTRQWTSVVAIDINGDGRTDLAGMVAGSPDVDVMLNAGGFLFDRFTIPTDAPVKSIVVGDYDGDLVSDLAIVAGDTTNPSTENDEIAIAFGAVDGGPAAPIVMGTFGIVDSIAAASIASSVVDLDAATDLVVVSDINGARRGAALLGNSSRELVAPFVTTTPSVLRPGTYDTSAGLDLASIDVDGDVSLLRGTGGGNLAVGASTPFATLGVCPVSGSADDGTGGCPANSTPGQLSGSDTTRTGGCIATSDCGATPVRGTCSGIVTCKQMANPKPMCPPGTFAAVKNGCWDDYCLTEAQCVLSAPPAAWASGIMSNGGETSIIALHSVSPATVSVGGVGTTGSGGGSGSGSGSDSGSGSGACANSQLTDVTILTPPAAGGSAWTVTGPTQLPAPLNCQRENSDQVRDLDNDGNGDWLVTMCAGSGGCSFGTTYVVWSQGGTLDISDLSSFNALTPQDPDAQCEHFVPIQADLDPDLELLTVCVSGSVTTAHIFDLGADHTFNEVSVFPIDPSAGDLITADFNGDHVTDLLTTTTSTTDAELHVYLQCATGDPTCSPIAEVGQ